MNEFPAVGDVPLLIQPAFFDDHACAQIREAMDRGTEDAAEIVGDEISRRDTIRRARSVEIGRTLLAFVEGRLESMRQPLERTFGCHLGQREGTGFLRYHAGGFYLPHRDRGEVAGWPGAARRRIAVVVFLNGGREASSAGTFEGGLLRLYSVDGAPVEVAPRGGLLVAFPADVLHEVLPVRDGIRDAAVDWFYDAESARCCSGVGE